MARKRVEIHAGEAEIISGLLLERDLIAGKLKTAIEMVCAREDLKIATFVGMDGDAVLLDLPDPAPLKLDRANGDLSHEGQNGAVPVAEGSETPENGQRDGAPWLLDASGNRKVP